MVESLLGGDCHHTRTAAFRLIFLPPGLSSQRAFGWDPFLFFCMPAKNTLA